MSNSQWSERANDARANRGGLGAPPAHFWQGPSNHTMYGYERGPVRRRGRRPNPSHGKGPLCEMRAVARGWAALQVAQVPDAALPLLDRTSRGTNGLASRPRISPIHIYNIFCHSLGPYSKYTSGSSPSPGVECVRMMDVENVQTPNAGKVRTMGVDSACVMSFKSARPVDVESARIMGVEALARWTSRAPA